jgi:hypothetical protein
VRHQPSLPEPALGQCNSARATASRPNSPAAVWCRRTPRPITHKTAGELQALLATFTIAYNTRRPHRSLIRRTPLAAYLARPKATPAAGSPDVAPDARVRRDGIDTSSVVTLRYHGQLHHIGIRRTHARTHTLFSVSDTACRVSLILASV